MPMDFVVFIDYNTMTFSVLQTLIESLISCAAKYKIDIQEKTLIS